MRPIGLLLCLAAALAGCSDERADGPVAVSVIGPGPTIADADRRPLTAPDAVLLGAVAQGLVRFDGAGQIEPGAAIRWAVSDDGLYYTFRIERDGPVDARLAAARLRAALARSSRNPLKPVLGAIDEVVAVTPEVIEIRLHAPRPNLLELFAQPELALVQRGTGSGPFRIVRRDGDALLLTPAGTSAADLDQTERRRREVRLRGERTALAVARFLAGQAQAVLGGRFNDLALAQVAAPPARALQFDPVQGLFGLAFTGSDGLAGSAEGRRALSMAVDRERIGALLGLRDWRGAATLVPQGLPDLPSPARPDWIDTPLAERRVIAADAVARLGRGENNRPPRLRVALPPGPGSRQLFTALRRDWLAIGVETDAVAADAPADLRLVDQVAPGNIASWYLRSFICERSRICSEQADAALIAARQAGSLEERTARLAEADLRLAEIVPFIPLAQPLRWSLIAPGLNGFQTNARGVHPLDHLRGS
jgi:oligopeptide transport system substrate-binding protein